MASASRAARLLAWVQLTHPFPVLLKVLACAAFASIATSGVPSLAPLAALLVAVCLINAGIGVLNDYCDRDLDAQSKPSKPLVQGLVRPWQALVVGVAALATGLAATRWLPWPARMSAVVYATAGVAYDLGLKSTRWSWAPFVVAFPLLPIWSWTAVRGWDRRLRWVYPVGAPLVLGIHLANTLPDLAVGSAQRRPGPRAPSRPPLVPPRVLGRVPRCPSPRTLADAPPNRPGQSRPRRPPCPRPPSSPAQYSLTATAPTPINAPRSPGTFGCSPSPPCRYRSAGSSPSPTTSTDPAWG